MQYIDNADLVYAVGLMSDAETNFNQKPIVRKDGNAKMSTNFFGLQFVYISTNKCNVTLRSSSGCFDKAKY